MKNLPFEKTPYEKIGRVIRACASMENSLWLILSILLRTDQFRARLLVAVIPNLTQKISLIKNLANTYLPEYEAKKLARLLERAKKLSAKRNMLAHGSMHINFVEDKNLVFREFFDDNGFGFKVVEFPEKELNDLALAVSEVTNDLGLIAVDISDKVYIDPRIHRENNEE